MRKNEKAIICLMCPRACHTKLIIGNRGNVERIVGAKCDIGKEYVLKEYTCPERILTTTVRTSKFSHPLLSVRTDRFVPKKLLKKCMILLSEVKIEPSIKIGEVVLYNILGTGANIIATQELNENKVI